MDKLVSKIAALGIPGLVLLVAIETSGYYGGAAILTALAALGPGGVVGGIITLGVIALISQGITEFGYERIAAAVLIEMYNKGETVDSLKCKINSMPISKALKLKLQELVNGFAEAQVG